MRAIFNFICVSCGDYSAGSSSRKSAGASLPEPPFSFPSLCFFYRAAPVLVFDSPLGPSVFFRSAAVSGSAASSGASAAGSPDPKPLVAWRVPCAGAAECTRYASMDFRGLLPINGAIRFLSGERL